MDPETLLQVGRISPRLYTLVSDRQVWRHLLREVEDLGEEQVAELVAFGRGLFGISGRPGMMSEVLKEAVERFIFLAGAVKLVIEIQSGDSEDHFEVFEIDVAYLNEFKILARAVGTKFTIKGMETPLIDNLYRPLDINESNEVHRMLDMLFPLFGYYIDNLDNKDLFIKILKMKKMVKKARHLLGL